MGEVALAALAALFFFAGAACGWVFAPKAADALAVKAGCGWRPVAAFGGAGGGRAVVLPEGIASVQGAASPRLYALLERAGCALFVGAGLSSAFFAAAHLADFLALALCLAAMAAALACDLRMRVIPAKACLVIAVAGLAHQVLAHGGEGALWGVVFSAAIAAVACAVNALLGKRCPEGALGGGDARCMVALSLASGADAPCGFAACYLAAGAVALAGCALGRLVPGEGIPLAPFLGLWLICGTAVC